MASRVKLLCTDRFALPLPSGHRFPQAKYALLRARVEQAPWASLMEPPAATDDQLLRAHRADYLARVRRGTLTPIEQRRLGLPWSPALAERARRSVGATVAACRAALADGGGASLAGGTHHAFADHGEGFCVFNDTAVAIRQLQAEGAVRRVLVIDCDVHQGNGSATILGTDDSVRILDVFCERNYPFPKIPTSLAVPLPAGTGDEPYHSALAAALPSALAHARPDLVIYLAGADPFIGDRLGRLHLTKTGLAERDRLVLEACRRGGVPVAVTMAGGYGADIQDTVDIHARTLQLAVEICGPAA